MQTAGCGLIHSSCHTEIETEIETNHWWILFEMIYPRDSMLFMRGGCINYSRSMHFAKPGWAKFTLWHQNNRPISVFYKLSKFSDWFWDYKKSLRCSAPCGLLHKFMKIHRYLVCMITLFEFWPFCTLNIRVSYWTSEGTAEETFHCSGYDVSVKTLKVLFAEIPFIRLFSAYFFTNFLLRTVHVAIVVSEFPTAKNID